LLGKELKYKYPCQAFSSLIFLPAVNRQKKAFCKSSGWRTVFACSSAGFLFRTHIPEIRNKKTFFWKMSGKIVRKIH
jgi:hypothetical protein